MILHLGFQPATKQQTNNIKLLAGDHKGLLGLDIYPFVMLETNAQEKGERALELIMLGFANT